MIMTKYFVPAAAAAAALAFSQPAYAKTVKWDLSIEYQASSIPGEVAQKFASELSRLSGGDMQVTIHYGSSLGYKSVDQFDAVDDGALPLASSFITSWSGIDPIFLVAALPVLAPTPADVKALYLAAKPHFQRKLEDNNQKLLAVTPWPNNGIWSKKEVTSTAALKGLKIRTFDPNGTATFAAVGAFPVQLSWGDVMPQLGAGALDAVVTSADGGSAGSLWDYLSVYNQVPYASPWQMIHMNAEIYDALNDQQKQWVGEAATAAEAYGWTAVKERTIRNFSQMRDKGMTIIERIDPVFIRELSAAGQNAIEKWKVDTGERGAALLEAYGKQVRE